MTPSTVARIDGMSERSVTISEAARLTGLPKSAIRGRVERGELRAVRRGGLRRISMDELAERGLLEAAQDERHAEPVSELLNRLERQADEISTLRVRLAIAQRQLAGERARRERLERGKRRRSAHGRRGGG